MTPASALHRRWWWLVVGAVLGAVVGLLVGSAAAAPGDVSSSRVLVSGNGTVKASATYDTSQYVSQRASTYAQIVTSDEVLRPVSAELGIATSDLAPEIGATVVGSTTVIAIDVHGTSPENARRVAQAVTDSFARVVTTLETPLSGQAPRVSITVISAPSTPIANSFDPLPASGGALAGLLLAAAAVAVAGSSRVLRACRRVYAWVSSEPDEASGGTPALVAPPFDVCPQPARPVPPPPAGSEGPLPAPNLSGLR